jgi:hypothetical protein
MESTLQNPALVAAKTTPKPIPSSIGSPQPTTASPTTAGWSSLKEWAYAGFAIDLASALIAHLSVGDGPAAWGGAAAKTGFHVRRLQARLSAAI